MRKKVIVIAVLYFFAFTGYTVERPIVESIRNDATRNKMLVSPLILSVFYLFKDISDVLEGKYERRMIVLSLLNLLFMVVYIMLLNSYIAKGLF